MGAQQQQNSTFNASQLSNNFGQRYPFQVSHQLVVPPELQFQLLFGTIFYPQQNVSSASTSSCATSSPSPTSHTNSRSLHTGAGSSNAGSGNTETQSGQNSSQLQAANSVLNSSTFSYANSFRAMNGLHPYSYHEAAAAAAAACAWPLGRLDPSSAGAFQGLAASQAFRRSGELSLFLPFSLNFLNLLTN